MISRFSKVAIATSNFMKQFYNGGFAPEFGVSVLKKNDRASSRLCIWNEEIRSKTGRKIKSLRTSDEFYGRHQNIHFVIYHFL